MTFFDEIKVSVRIRNNACKLTNDSHDHLYPANLNVFIPGVESTTRGGKKKVAKKTYNPVIQNPIY